MCSYKDKDKLQRAFNDFRCLSISVKKHVEIIYTNITEKIY